MKDFSGLSFEELKKLYTNDVLDFLEMQNVKFAVENEIKKRELNEKGK